MHEIEPKEEVRCERCEHLAEHPETIGVCICEHRCKPDSIVTPNPKPPKPIKPNAEGCCPYCFLKSTVYERAGKYYCMKCSHQISEPPENDGEKGEGIVTSLEEDKELLEFWEQELNHNWGSDLLIEQVGKLLAAKERCVRAECKEVINKHFPETYYPRRDSCVDEILNPPQK